MTTSLQRIKIFEYALNQEQTGMSFFQESLRRMGVGAAVSAFKRLVQEEEAHIKFICGILEDLRKGADPGIRELDGLILEPTNYFDERAESEFLQLCLEGSMVPDVTVFNTAWLIEKDLSEYYELAASKTDGSAREALKMLAGWEKQHERFFREYRDRLSKVYAEMPWGG
ncbi:MAG: ferritin family protein [Thermodesulfobacteriota bacterium]